MELFGALAKAVTVAKLLQNMVGPWGLEPQTSTVSTHKGMAHHRFTAFCRGFLACCILVHSPAITTLLSHNLRHKTDCDVAGA